nr:ParM/StbA family protein [uncultured Cellulosilyticum sp.]
MQVIAVNSGNYGTKAKSKSNEINFRTKVQENPEADKFIMLDGRKYEIGEGNIDIDNLKHDSIVHKLCTLFAVSILHEQHDVFLVTCLPVNQFKRHDFREAYRRSLIGDWEITTNRGKDIFRIKDVIVYMEGAAALLAYQEAYRNSIVSVVDIGGYNVNVSQYNNMHLISGTEDDFDLGVYNIKTKIRNNINQQLNVHLKEYELNHIMKNPSMDQYKIISKYYTSFINELRNELKQKGYNLSLNQILFTGGGAMDLEVQLVQEFSNCSIGSVFDTVRGLYKLGVRKCSSV